MSEAPNQGEGLEKARRNRKAWIIAGAFASVPMMLASLYCRFR